MMLGCESRAGAIKMCSERETDRKRNLTVYYYYYLGGAILKSVNQKLFN